MKNKPEYESHMSRLTPQEILEGASPARPTCLSKLRQVITLRRQKKWGVGKKPKAFVVYSPLHGRHENSGICVFPYWVLGHPPSSPPRDTGEEAQSTLTFSTFMPIVARRAVGDLQWHARVPEIHAYVGILAASTFFRLFQKYHCNYQTKSHLHNWSRK